MNSVSERLQDDFQAFMKLFNRFSAMLHVAAPGIIQSFNADTQTVSVQLAIKERVTLDGDNNNSRFTDDRAIPVLSDLPIVFPRAGGYSLTLPIKKGDECLVVFSDTCPDAWFQSGLGQDGKGQSQMFKRRHSLSDGFAIVGVGSQPNKISGYSTDSAQLRNEAGDSVVEVKDGVVNVLSAAVNLSNASSIYKLVDERIVTALNAMTWNVTNATPVVAGPVIAGPGPVVPLVLANVATLKTKAG